MNMIEYVNASQETMTSNPSNAFILFWIEKEAFISANDLSKRTGISLNNVTRCLRNLYSHQFIKVHNDIYSLSPEGVRAINRLDLSRTWINLLFENTLLYDEEKELYTSLFTSLRSDDYNQNRSFVYFLRNNVDNDMSQTSVQVEIPVDEVKQKVANTFVIITFLFHETAHFFSKHKEEFSNVYQSLQDLSAFSKMHECITRSFFSLEKWNKMIFIAPGNHDLFVNDTIEKMNQTAAVEKREVKYDKSTSIYSKFNQYLQCLLSEDEFVGKFKSTLIERAKQIEQLNILYAGTFENNNQTISAKEMVINSPASGVTNQMWDASHVQIGTPVVMERYSAVGNSSRLTKPMHNDLQLSTVIEISMFVRMCVDLYRSDVRRRDKVLDDLRIVFGSDTEYRRKIVIANGFTPAFFRVIGRKRLESLRELLMEIDSDFYQNIRM